MAVELREYQERLVNDVREAFRQHKRVLAVSPTGSGKTVVFAYITTAAAKKGNRITLLAHRTEIVAQISQALDRMGVRHGRIQPGHTMTDDLVQVAMVQTLARRLDRVVQPNLLVIDEAHHGVAGTWKAITEAWPTSRILGVTATPQRLDGRGLDDAFDTMVLGPTVKTLISAKHLASYRYLSPPRVANLSKIKTKMGDFDTAESAAEMSKPVVVGDAVEHYVRHLAGRPAIAFCVTVEHAELVAEAFTAAGVRSASVDGTMDPGTRRDRIEGIGNGRYQVLTSCALISEGLDIPVVAGAILLRPTKSLAMFLQQVGRALRPKEDGSYAIILDHVGNVERFGLPDRDRPWSLKGKVKSEVSTTTCEVCFRVFDTAPNWKKEAQCGFDEMLKELPEHERPEAIRVANVLPDGMPAECAIRASVKGASEGVELPEIVDGDLEERVEIPESDWHIGYDLVLSRGDRWRELLKLADTREKLEQISRARGYKKGWVSHVLRERAAGAQTDIAFRAAAAEQPPQQGAPPEWSSWRWKAPRHEIEDVIDP